MANKKKKGVVKLKGREIVVPILNNEYRVIVCWGDQHYCKKVLHDWHYPEDAVAYVDEFFFGDDWRGRCFSHPKCHPVILLRCYPNTPQEIATLAHEAVHAVVNIFEGICEESYDEVFAHSVGAIVRLVLKEGK